MEEDNDDSKTPAAEDDGLSLFLSDRQRFKLYSAGRHLSNLKSLEQKYGSIATVEAKMQAEMEIDCFLAEIIGAINALLVQINEKFDLDLDINQADFERVQSGLTSRTKKIDLLGELAAARQYGNWYWQIVELRNYSLHGSLMAKSAIGHSSSSYSSPRVHFRKDPRNPEFSPPMDLEVIPYLQQCLSRTEELIERIRSKEPLLRP